MTDTAHEPSPMLELLGGFIHELREAGIPVSLSENIDAMEAVRHIPLEDREALKYALAATMVKNDSHWRAFETVFEVYFSLRGKEYGIVDPDADGEGESDSLDMEGVAQQGRGDGSGGSSSNRAGSSTPRRGPHSSRQAGGTAAGSSRPARAAQAQAQARGTVR